MDTRETIPLNDGDVSGAAHNEQLPDTSPDTTESAEGTRLEGQLSRRDQRMAEVAEKAKAEREAGRRAAALMNNPDLSEDDYDADIAARKAKESEPESPWPDGDVHADQEGPKATQAEAPATPPETNGWRTRDDGTRVKTLKVNGESVEITEQEYDRRIQKDIAGDQKLRLASEMERQLREREQNLRQYEDRLRGQVPPSKQGVPADLEKTLTEYHEALLDGDTDAARAKLLAVMEAGRQSSTPNIDEISARVATQVERSQQQREQVSSMESGWAKFQQDYPEIASHNGRLAYADTIVKRLRSEQPNLKPGEVILEAGRIAAEELGLSKTEVKPQVVTQPGSTRDERMERKSNIRPLPQASGKRHEQPEKPRVDNSPEAKIARMRASRVTG